MSLFDAMERDVNEDNDTTHLTISESSSSPSSNIASWNEDIDPWKYPPTSRRRLNRDAIVLPADGPCIDIPCLRHKRKVGKLIIGYETTTENGRPKFLCVVPACWPMLIFTECLIGGISTMCYYSFLPYLGWFWWCLSFILLFYVCGSLFKTATSDPGIVMRVAEQVDSSWIWSERAQTYH
jgi:hypothetical protein